MNPVTEATTFSLDTRLAGDTHFVAESELSLLLWFDERRYPWLVLVPKRPGLSELYELSRADRAQVMEESCAIARTLREEFSAFKVNIGALGNIVRQLHVHHVARFEQDPAWPSPVWGHSPRQPHDLSALTERTTRLRRSALTALFSFPP